MGNIRILICDDHDLIREGIINRLSGQPGIFIVGEAANGAEMIAQYEKLKPDLIISDIEMPPGISGIDALKQLKAKYPLIKVLFVSVYGPDQYLYPIVKAGGLGLLDKSPARGEFLYAINEAMESRQYFGPHYNNEQINAIIKEYEKAPDYFDFTAPIQPTPTENDVLEFISQVMTSQEIANEMKVSLSTINTHRTNLIKKFSLKNGPDLIRFAINYSASKEINPNPSLSKPKQ